LNAYGAHILRDGKTREIPKRRRLKLRAGDEIYIGEVCARSELPDSLATRHLSEVE
jgi:ribosome-associated protein YbcJ (S4-like RNA binding protein)